MRIGQDLGIGEAAELIADRVEIALAKPIIRPLPCAQRLGQFGTQGSMIGIEQCAAGFAQLPCLRAQAEIGGAEYLVLTHRQAANQLGQRFSKGKLRDDPVEPTVRCPGPCHHGLDRGDAGCHPCQTVRGALVRIHPAIPDPSGKGDTAGGKIGLCRRALGPEHPILRHFSPSRPFRTAHVDARVDAHVGARADARVDLNQLALLRIAECKHCYYRHGMKVNVAFLSSDIGRLFRKRFAASARSFGVTGPQWRMLAAIQRDPGTNQGALANWLEVEPITAGRMIDRLEKLGLVERRHDPADRRRWRMHLTAEAETLMNRMSTCAQTVLADAVAGFSESEHAQLLALLERVRTNLSDDSSQDACNG